MNKKTEKLETLLSNLLIFSEIDSILGRTDLTNEDLLQELERLPADQAYLERLRERVMTKRDWYSEERLKQVEQF